MDKILRVSSFIVVGFFFVISIGLLFLVTVIAFISEDADVFIQIRPLLVVVWVAILIILILIYRGYLKKKKILAEERLESIREGGIEEPRIFRELNSEEKVWLALFHKKSYQLVNNLWWLAPFFIILDLVMLTLTIKFPDLAQLFFVVLAVQISLLASLFKEVPLYLDLRSPVFKVQGKVIDLETDKYGTRFKVKSIQFSGKHAELPEKLMNYEEVVIEYSPHTKHIWKIYKTEDI